MIRVSRGADPEPPRLRRARYENLPRLREKLARGQSLDRTIDCVDYKAGKERLHTQQLGRCAYCERPKDLAEADLEHFRPWAHYWWLAWTWTNQLVACKRCNGGYKRDHFDLIDERRRAGSEGASLGAETPKFIDPSAEDPLDHIRFVRVAGRWMPVPRAGSARGEYTIDKLGLETLGPRYDEYWIEAIQPQVGAIRSAMNARVARGVQQAWRRALRRLFRESAPFQALAYDALDSEFPAPVRARWRLELPRPGAGPDPVHAEPFVDELQPETRAAIYVLRDGDTWAAAILALCRERPMTYADLMRYLGRSQSTVAKYVNPLVTAGRLRRSKAGRLEVFETV